MSNVHKLSQVYIIYYSGHIEKSRPFLFFGLLKCYSQCPQVHTQTNFVAVITIDKLIWYFTRLYASLRF